MFNITRICSFLRGSSDFWGFFSGATVPVLGLPGWFPPPLLNDSAALSAYIPLGHVSPPHSSYAVPRWFRTVNKVLDGSIGLQAHNPGSVPHSCLFRLRAYQPRQAQKPTMETMVTTTRANVFPASLASAGRIRERRMSHMMAAAFGSPSSGAMSSQVNRSGSQASESDDAKSGQTSWSAQPITHLLYSSLACRMFCFCCHVSKTTPYPYLMEFPSSRDLFL